VVNNKASGDEAAAGTTYDKSGFKMDLVHKLYKIGREITDTVTRRGAARITVASLRWGKGMNVVRQVSHKELEGMPGVCDGMQEQHGNTRRVSLLRIGKLNFVRKPNRLENRYHVHIL
jgi:hypothetical protein